MKFAEALEVLKKGGAIKLPHWKGFWKKEGDTVKMHCRNGKILDIRETEDVFYTLGNIASEEWEVSGSYLKPDENNVFTMRFGEALRMAGQGHQIARKGWNGKEQYVELATGISYKNTVGDLINAEHEAIGNAALAFVGTSGVQVGWLASQADMLAEDWYVRK